MAQVLVYFTFIVTAFCAPLHMDKGAMEYLVQFGYLSPLKIGLRNSQNAASKALIDFQMFVGLQPTGQMDEPTHEMMLKPRCGLKDKHDSEQVYSRRERFTTLGGVWAKDELTYTVDTYPELPRAAVDEEIRCAVTLWAAASPRLSFQHVQNSEHADIRITFLDGDHNDGMSFDGRGKVLAHAFPPTNGSIHFDIAEPWTIRCVEGQNLLDTAVHELGHALGLDHSHIPGSVMFPYAKGYNPRLSLHEDDIRGIQELYGVDQTRFSHGANEHRTFQCRADVMKKMGSECVKTNVGAVQHPAMLTAVFIAVLLAMGQY